MIIKHFAVYRAMAISLGIMLILAFGLLPPSGVIIDLIG